MTFVICLVTHKHYPHVDFYCCSFHDHHLRGMNKSLICVFSEKGQCCAEKRRTAGVYEKQEQQRQREDGSV